MEIGLALLVLAMVALGLLAPLRRKARRVERIAPWELGLLYGPDGFVRELSPGVHVRMDPFARSMVHRVATIPRTLPSQTIEAISQDQFAFRLAITAVLAVTDARTFVEHTPGPPNENAAANWTGAADTRFERFTPALSAAVLAAVAARTLEDFLADPAATMAQAEAQVGAVVPGTRLDALLLTGVTLPPEVRKMFTEVERARREGLAGLERARAEQASLRALANAARNLADNPALAQLRMLQVMENAKGAKTFVLGGTPQDPGKTPHSPD